MRKSRIIGEKPIEEASAQELLFLAQAISKSIEVPSSDEATIDNSGQNHKLLEDYKAELAEYGIDIEVSETFEKAKHIPTTLVGKMLDQVGNKIDQIENRLNEIGWRLYGKIASKNPNLAVVLWTLYDDPLGKAAVNYAGEKAAEGILSSAEYILGQEKVDQAKEKAFKGIEYIIDHSTQGQRKTVGSSVNVGSLLPFFKMKTILAAAMVGLKKGVKPDVSDGVETLVKTGLNKEIKKEGIQKGVAATKIETGILKVGTDAGGVYKHGIDIDANLLKEEIKFLDDLNHPKLRAKFDKHGEDFGMQGMNFNKENAELFKPKIRVHINDPATIPIAGRYTTGGVGDVVHYYNPKTKINVMKDMDSQFVSGWKLREKQQEFLKLKSQIGGQKQK